MLASILIQENETVFNLKRSSSGTSTNTMDACSDNQVLFGISDQPENSENLPVTTPSSAPAHSSSSSSLLAVPPQQETTNEALSGTATVNSVPTVCSPRPFLCAILDSMDCVENDYAALFSICLLEALKQNRGEWVQKLTSSFILFV